MRLRKLPMLVVVSLVAASCATTPLSQFDAGIRDRATVDADKLACWQQAEAANPMPGQYAARTSGTMLLLGPIAGPAVNHSLTTDEDRAWGQRVVRAAEACMVDPGYAVRGAK